MKLALCLFGQARFIDNEQASDLYKAFVIDKYDVDIYGHVWLSDSYQPSTWSVNRQIQAPVDTVSKIRKQYPGIKLFFENSREFDSDLNKNNVLSQIYSINAVVDTIENPSQYKFILLGRYDCMLTRFKSIEDLGAGYYGTIKHTTFADQLLIASPEYLDAYKMYQRIQEPEELKVAVASVEQFKLNHFRSTYPGVSFLYHDFNVGLIRNL